MGMDCFFTIKYKLRSLHYQTRDRKKQVTMYERILYMLTTNETITSFLVGIL